MTPPGDSRDVKVPFPADYHADLAGKNAVFEITVKDIKSRVLPELNDEFAKSLGLEGLEDLKERTRQGLKTQYDRTARLHLKRQLLDKLAESINRQLKQRKRPRPVTGIAAS